MKTLRPFLIIAALFCLTSAARAEDSNPTETPLVPINRERQPQPIEADDQKRRLGHARAVRERLENERARTIKRMVGNGDVTKEDAEILVDQVPTIEEILASAEKKPNETEPTPQQTPAPNTPETGTEPATL